MSSSLGRSASRRFLFIAAIVFLGVVVNLVSKKLLVLVLHNPGGVLLPMGITSSPWISEIFMGVMYTHGVIKLIL